VSAYITSRRMKVTGQPPRRRGKQNILVPGRLCVSALNS
jgi:hypothetical protein